MHPSSVHFGDGATAVVVGRSARNRGLLSQAHRTDGTLNRAVVCGGAGEEWWNSGPLRTRFPDREAARRMLLSICDVADGVCTEACTRAGVDRSQITFFAAHQATSWWRRVVQEHLGLSGARTLDTYPWTGSLSAANVPFVLHRAEADGILQPGDVVGLFQGGTGASYSFALLRW
jgi:3-oxoacyl-[acyl-carrier-protein] synthase-3